MTDNLPHRPRLLPGLPVLHRRAGEAQVGLNPRHAVVASGLSDALAETLRCLDGRHTTPELIERTDPDQRAALRTMLCQLTEAGLLEDAAEDAANAGAQTNPDTTHWRLRTGQSRSRVALRRRRMSVVVHGAGRLAVATGCLLAAAGVGTVVPATQGTVQPQDVGTGYAEADVDAPRVTAAEAALRRASATVRTSLSRRRKHPDLAVLADSAVPEPEVVAGLHTAEVPHLLLRVREGVGWVGPLVLPRRTGCLRCLDLHRSDRDPCWPAVAAQLAGKAQPAELSAALASAAFGAAQALCLLDERPTLLWNATVLIDPFTTETTRRTWSPHPACHCLAAA